MCLHHAKDICGCPHSKKILKYRYTMSELHQMLAMLRSKTEAYQSWVNKVEELLDGGETEKGG